MMFVSNPRLEFRSSAEQSANSYSRSAQYASRLLLVGLVVLVAVRNGLGQHATESSTSDVASAEVHDEGEMVAGDHANGAEHGSEAHGNSNPLSVDPDLAIVTLVVFLLLFAILRKFAWGPIRTALDSREKGIATLLEESKRSNEESRRLLEEHQLRLSKSGDEVRELLDQARRDAEAHKQRIMAEAEHAATAQKQRAVKEIVAAKDAALEELARTSVDQAVGLAGRIVGRQLNKEDHQQLIQESLQRFPSDN